MTSDVYRTAVNTSLPFLNAYCLFLSRYHSSLVLIQYHIFLMRFPGLTSVGFVLISVAVDMDVNTQAYDMPGIEFGGKHVK